MTSSQLHGTIMFAARHRYDIGGFISTWIQKTNLKRKGDGDSRLNFYIFYLPGGSQLDPFTCDIAPFKYEPCLTCNQYKEGIEVLGTNAK